MSGLGVDLKLLIIQTINFLILFLVLKKWVYPPFIKFLDERARKIQESLTASQKMRDEIKEFESQKEKELDEMRKKSQAIIEEVRSEAQLERKRIIADAEKEGDEIIAEAKKQIAVEKEKSSGRTREEITDLAIEISKKILGELDEAEAHRLIDQALTEKKYE